MGLNGASTIIALPDEYPLLIIRIAVPLKVGSVAIPTRRASSRVRIVAVGQNRGSWFDAEVERPGIADMKDTKHMAMSEKSRITINRIVSFLAGGLFVFAVMSFTVLNTAKEQNVALADQLDVSVNEPSRLLADAKAFFEGGNFLKARETLSALIEKRPGSNEATEGKALDQTIAMAETKANDAWEAASIAVKAKWTAERTAELRAKAEEAKSDLEKGMVDTLAKEWERAEDSVRTAWELES